MSDEWTSRRNRAPQTRRSWQIVLAALVASAVGGAWALWAQERVGTPLPAGGGEAGTAYREFLRAVRENDSQALKPLIPDRNLRGLQTEDPELQKLLSQIRSKLPADVEILQGSTLGKNALLLARAIGEKRDILEYGMAVMVLEGDRWKVEAPWQMPVPAPKQEDLLQNRIWANEASAAGGLKTIAAAQTDYMNNSSPHSFANTLEKLRTGTGAGEVRYIDDRLGSGEKNGYVFTLVAGAFIQGAYYAWSAEAHPVTYKETGTRSFYIDETGILLGADRGGKPGTLQMPEI